MSPTPFNCLTRLRRELNHQDATPAASSRRTARILRHFETPHQVSFADDESNGRTVLELTTGDCPGLLSSVGRAFMECGIRLQNAKIATIGARVEDTFFVTDRENRPLRDAAQYVALREALVRHLDDQAG